MDVKGRYKSRYATATIASYTTAGEAVNDTHALQLGFRKIVGIDFEDSVSSTGDVWSFDRATNKITCRETGAVVSTPLAEAGSTENAGVVRCVVYGF